MISRIIGLIVILAIIWAVIGVYNNLVELRSHVDDALRQIYTLLRRRKDLVPDLLVNTKNLAIEDWTAVEEVAFAHGIAVAAETPAEAMQADADLADALERLFAAADEIPEVANNENFVHLRSLFESTDRKLKSACEEYEECVETYNEGIKKFPNSILASLFQFKEHEGLEAFQVDAR